MITSRNNKFLKGRFCGLLISVVLFCSVSAAQAAVALPPGYTEVACITVTDQEQYINTGFTPYWMTDIEAHFSVPNFSSQNVLYWTRNSGSFAFITKANTADPTKTNKVRAYRSSDGSSNVETTLPEYLTSTDILYSTKMVDNKTDNTFTVNGQKVNFVAATGTGPMPNMFLFRLNDNGSLYSDVKATVGMKLYSFTIFQGGAAKANFVPCLNSDSVAGLYDTVRNTFYSNAGSGGSFGYETLSSALEVTGSPEQAGTPSPAYGRTYGLAPGQTLAVSCGETQCTNAAETVVYSCAGWKLYSIDGDIVSQGAGTSFDYTHPDSAAYRRLEWQWETSKVKGTVDVDAGGSVSPSGTAWYALDMPVTVTATPDSGKEFFGWTGTLPSGISAVSASVTFTPTAPFEMTANFGTCFCVATTGNDDNPGTEVEPFATISNAIEKADAAIAGGAQSVTIQVADGTYPENGLVVTNAIVIIGNASDRTAVKIGISGARVFRIAHADAALRNLTVQNGTVTAADVAYAGGNVRLEAGTVVNCVLTGGGKAKLTDYRGGNLYISAGSVVDCLMTSPLAGPGMYGANAYIAGGVVSRCILENAPKTSSWTAIGAGACLVGGVIENCLLRGNYAGRGTIALYNSAKAVNCTIVGNVPETFVGGGIAGVMITGNSASVINCVIFDNGGTATSEWANQSGARFFNCVSTVENASGVNWTTLPLTNRSSYFKDDEYWTPLLGSPMVDAGDDSRYPSTSSQTDIAGNARISGSHIDIGCSEFDQSSLSYTATPDSHPSILKGNTVDFVCTAAGAAGTVTFELDFGDGSAHLVTTDTQISHQYDVCGLFPTRIRAKDGDGEYGDWETMIVPIRVSEPDIYVSTEGSDANAGTAAAPFRTITHALATLTNVTSACSTDVDGVTVHIATGTYEENALPAIASRVTVEGNASDRTAVKIGKTGARIFCLTDEDAALRNLTVQNGTVTAADISYAGGNVRLENGTVTNCVLTGGGNSSLTDDKGGNLYISAGSVVDCLMTSPLAGPGMYGANAYIAGGVVSRSILENAPKTSSWTALGAGAYLTGGVIENCLVRDNKAGRGAIYLDAASAKAVNCTIVGNTPVSGSGAGVGGVYVNNGSASVVNCVIYGNGGTATAEWGNKNAARFFSCAFAADAAYSGTASTVLNLTDDAFKNFAGGDYRPKRGGALINAGDNTLYSSYATSELDLDGNERVSNRTIDLGCWEVESNVGFRIIVR